MAKLLQVMHNFDSTPEEAPLIQVCSAPYQCALYANRPWQIDLFEMHLEATIIQRTFGAEPTKSALATKSSSLEETSWEEISR